MIAATAPLVEPPLALDGQSLTLGDLVAVARQGRRVALAPEARVAVGASRHLVEEVLRRGEVVYGVNTGFGELARTRVPPHALRALQLNLVRSHAAGVGEPLPRDAVRAMMLLRANALAAGYSGIRPEVVDLLLEMLNRGVHPVVPSQGSVGASGDLAPLAHLALVLVGEGRAEVDGKALPGATALRRRDLRPVTLEAKEGLALVNGTQLTTAVGALALHDAAILLDAAEVAGAMSLEALKGTDVPFHPAIQRVRPHPGQAASAEHLRALLAGSEILASHRDCDKVQDPYSLRCMPQVLGTSRDALAYCREVIAVEMNSATDNPLCFPEEGRVLSGGNFHAQPVAVAMDLLKIAVAEVGSLSERRTFLLLDGARSGLSAFLADEPGLESGYMAAQYTAAALVSENKGLAHPASVDSIPTSGGQEDHVSMGPIAARQAARMVENARRVVAIELLCAARGVERHAPLRPGKGVARALATLRAAVPQRPRDHALGDEIETVAGLIRDRRFPGWPSSR